MWQLVNRWNEIISFHLFVNKKFLLCGMVFAFSKAVALYSNGLELNFIRLLGSNRHLAGAFGIGETPGLAEEVYFLADCSIVIAQGDTQAQRHKKIKKTLCLCAWVVACFKYLLIHKNFVPKKWYWKGKNCEKTCPPGQTMALYLPRIIHFGMDWSSNIHEPHHAPQWQYSEWREDLCV